MEAVSQLCDAHLAGLYELGQNTTGPEIIDILREVTTNNLSGNTCFINFFCLASTNI